MPTIFGRMARKDKPKEVLLSNQDQQLSIDNPEQVFNSNFYGSFSPASRREVFLGNLVANQIRLFEMDAERMQRLAGKTLPTL